MKDVQGRVAFVTGAASGIGLAIARTLAAAGMRLALVDIEESALRVASAELARGGANVLPIVADVASFESVSRAVDLACAQLGTIDLLCNNAGVGLEGPVESWTTEGWAWVMGVNVMGVVNGVRAVTPILKANEGGGHIVNVSSIGGLSAAANHGQYGATKFAVVGLSQSLRDELAPHGIGVTVVCPGFVKSRIATSGRNAPQDLRERQSWLMGGGFQGPAAALFRMIEDRVETGLDASEVGAMTLDAILNNDFYVLTETEFLSEVERRRRALAKAIDKITARDSPALSREIARG